MKGILMIIKTYNVLILGSKNSVRSIMAEALFNTMGDGVYKAYSAGTAPTGVVNRFALEQIRGIDYPVKKLRSKSWEEFSQSKAPQMNFVITVCDEVAKQPLPAWLGTSVKAHWRFDDPTAVEGSFDEKKEVFKNVFQQIQNRIDLFTQLPLAHLNQELLNQAMEKWPNH